MHGPPLKPDVVAFGAYEIHLTTHELFKHGTRIRLAPQAFHVLRMLLDSRGNLVTREQFHRALWPADTFVDFDHGLNNAIKKIRDVLNDSAESPRYIETLPRLGYRFIAPLNGYSETVAVETETASVEIEDTGKSAPVSGSLNPQEAGEFDNSAGRVLQRGWALRWTIIGAVGVLTCLMVAAVWSRGLTAKSAAQPAIKSIAVLPLKNLSGDPSHEYLADGMTEELIGRLAAIHDLRVISRTSVMGFKDTHLSVPEIARSLNVDAIVEGSLMRDGDRIRVHAQLIRAATDEHFWSVEYDRELNDVLALESDLAQAIAEKVEVSVTGQERARLVAARPVTPEVYERYVKARNDAENTKAHIEQRISDFQDTIRKDPTFAPAYVGLAETYISYQDIGIGAPPSVIRPKAIEAARKALELDPELAEAHALLAEMYQKQWKWAESEAEYKRALELMPSNASAHRGYAYWLTCQGRTEEAVAWVERGRELDPLGSADTVGYVLLMARRYVESIREYRSVLAAHPDSTNARWGLGFALMMNNQIDDAISELEKTVALLDRSPGSIALLATAYGRAGKRSTALALIEELKQRRQKAYIPSGAFITPYLAIADYDEAFIWCGEAVKEQSAILQWIKVIPLFDPVRSDPRFADLLLRVGLNYVR